jgi:anhydro-N-acetylmuramic acid kinase
MAALGEQLPSVTIRHIDDFGLSSAAKEAFAFAILGFLTWHGIPAVDPRYTGARRAAILGSITPGAEPLRLPPPIAVAPTRLVLH